MKTLIKDNLHSGLWKTGPDQEIRGDPSRGVQGFHPPGGDQGRALQSAGEEPASR